MPPVFRSRFFLGACLVLAVALCYIPAMGAGFVWDDDLLVTENPLVKGADSLPYVWASSASTDYTPLTITAFWLQWRIWGDNATGYHLVNILLAALSALLLWRVLERLGIPGAWLGALLFAVHPVNAASVAWVAELKNSLSLPFYLAAIGLYLRFLESRKAAPYVFALLAAACALLSKGSTVILPLELLLCAWWKQRRVTGSHLLGLIPFASLSAGAAAVTIHFQSRVTEVLPAPLPERIARAGHAIWFYLGKDIWPLRLCAVYPKWPLGANFLPLILAALLALALWLGRKRLGRGPFFAWAYFVIALLPVLGILNMSFLDQAYVADWWQQLALPGVLALAGAGIAMAWARARAPVAVLTALLVLGLGALTWNEAAGYESMETHCRRTLACNPDAWTAHNNLGSVLNTEGRLDEAAHEYEIALRLKPLDSSAHSNLGTVYARLHRFDDAIAEYRAALGILPDNAKYWFNLGNALRARRRNDEAVDAFSHAIDNNARWTAARYDMGCVLLDLDRPDEAGRQAQVIVALDPAAISGHYLLARSAAAIGRFDIAAAEAATALDIAQRSGDEKTIRQMRETLDACKAGKVPAEPEL
jgi:tetratricopeptide (TPR) repeat protein